MTQTAAVFLLLAGLAPGFARAESCSSPPQPILELRMPAAVAVHPHVVSTAELERFAGPAAPHALMTMRYTLDAEIALVPAPAACAGGIVIIRFGIVRRQMLLAREAAAAPCIRAALLAHERVHSRIIADGARDFIEQRRPQLNRVVNDAISPERPRDEAARDASAVSRIYAALQRLIAEFGDNMRGPLREAGDTPRALAQLAGACGGAVGVLDRSIRQHAVPL